MNINYFFLTGVLLLISTMSGYSQTEFQVKQQSLPNPDNEPAAVFPLPTDRQMKWQETEFYAFFHYGMNTYTNREWGLGSEDTKLFAPVAQGSKSSRNERWNCCSKAP